MTDLEGGVASEALNTPAGAWKRAVDFGESLILVAERHGPKLPQRCAERGEHGENQQRMGTRKAFADRAGT